MQAQRRSDVSGQDEEERVEVVQGTSALSSEAAMVWGLDVYEGNAAPDLYPTSYVHIAPLLLGVMYKQLSMAQTRFCSLQHFTESSGDPVQADLGC